MNDSIVSAGSFEGYWAYVAAPISLFLALHFVRRISKVRSIYSKFIWLITIVEVAVSVAAAYCLGLILEALILGVGLDWRFVKDGELPTLLLHIATFMGAARFVEVWLLSLSTTDDRLSTSRLTRTVLYGVGLLLGVLAFLVSHGYTFLSISTGAIAAIVAFALQKTMGDLIAGVAMSLEGAFSIGEWIRLEDGTEGEIVDIDWRATHMKGWDRAIMVIPNTALANQSFVKLPRRKHPYAQSYQLSVSRAHDPEFVKSLLIDAAKNAEGVLDRPAPAIRLADISSDPYQYSLWVHFENYMAMFAGRDELFSNIHGAFQNAGLAISPEILSIHNDLADPNGSRPIRDVSDKSSKAK